MLELSRAVPADPVILIGSGISGLGVGAILAELGKEVCVLEAHPSLIGGHARSFEIEGFRFCAGPQYVWHFGPGGIGHRFLSFLGLEQSIPFDSMNPDGFDRIVVGDREPFDIPMGLERMEKAAIDRFPTERQGLERLFTALEHLEAVAARVFENGLYHRSGIGMRWGVLCSRNISIASKIATLKMDSWTLADLFDHCDLSPGARRLLFGHEGIFAEPQSCLSAVAFAAATSLYHSGATYPRFGFSSLIEGLRGKIEQRGGRVLCGRKVTRLKTEGSRVTGVTCENGESYAAGTVISNISPRQTGRLLGMPRRRYRYQPSASTISCYLGISEYPGLKEAMDGRNLWWYANDVEYEYEYPDLKKPPGMAFIGSPSSHGIENANVNPADVSLSVFVPGGFAQAAAAARKSPQTHDALRDQATRQVVALMDQLFPGLATHVRVAKTLTPLDLHRELCCENGEIYGHRMTVHGMLARPDGFPKLKNLRLVGASVGLAGIASGLRSAAYLVEKLTGKRI